MKLNELNLNQVFGDYGAAAMKQAGNRLTGKFTDNAEGKLSVQDKIAKDKFISDFIGRASTNLNSAIQSGLVDPNIKAGAPAAEEPPQGNPQPKGATPPAGQPPAGQQTPPSGQPPAGQQTPPQQQTPAGQQTPPQAPGAPKTPEQIRKEKQAAAGQVAQQQMAANPAPAKPGAPAAPAQQAKMTPQQVAALKGRLKAGATATSGQSGFKNYVGGSGERMTSVDKSGAPVFQKIQRESKYAKLDYILESIINIDEAQEAQSISEYLENMFNQYLGVPITDPKAKAQIKTLADQAQASYPKMTNALTQMANLGFAISYSQGSGSTQSAGATTSQPASAMDALKAGVEQGLGNAPNNAGATNTEPAAASGNTAYDEVMSVVGKMSKDEKQQLLTSLTKAAPTSNAGAGAFDQMSKQLQQPKTTTNSIANRQQKLGKVAPGNKGLPNPDEQAKFDKLVQQKLAAQA